MFKKLIAPSKPAVDSLLSLINMISPRKSPNKKKKTIIHGILNNIPTRSKQIDLLKSLFGERDENTVPFIFIYGHSATGKSFTMESILKELQLPFTWTNCIEVYNPRLIMEHILKSLSGTELLKENNYKGYDNCTNMCDFIRLLKNVILERKLHNETVYLIFDNAERLRKLPPIALAAILRLQELSQMNICVILISEIIWDKFRNDFPLLEPFIVHFPDYNQDETVTILERDCPNNVSLDFFRKYVKLVLGFFFIATRNVQELRYIAISNFPHYYKPVSLGEATTADTRKLWQYVVPYLSKALNSLYLRENDSLSETNNKPIERSVDSNIGRAIFELPLYSKQLLIAAYIASYNPAGTDKKFFLKVKEILMK